METPCRVVDTRQLLGAYEELLPQVAELPLRISGNSMAPFLRDGRDTVFLSSIHAPLKVGDMVLYRRRNGQYILHRICKIQGDSCTMIGDNQLGAEPGISRSQIIARVHRVIRKGKTLTPHSFCWLFFEKVWVRMLPLRPLCHKCWHALKKI